MWLALLIGIIWAVDGLLFWVGGTRDIAVICGVFAVMPYLLTVFQRHLAGPVAARAYLAAQRARGIGGDEARERIHELAPDGVTFDTDDVPSWPTYLIMLLTLGAIVALVISAVRVAF